MDNLEHYTPTEFLAAINLTLRGGFEEAYLEGEVASYKESHGKWVFFDLKDETSSVNCFMPIWNLHFPIEDGMKIVLRGTPKVTDWGKFSVTVADLRPLGEGNLKKAFEKLKQKLASEGLFSAARKREIPQDIARLGVISSTGAAGFADFIKIINARWGGMRVQVANTQVQGFEAPEQIKRALEYFNERGEVEVIAILRGGGSADDLACFNDEALVRAVAASRIPVVTGIGHEVDETLTDLAADLAASTPSNLAELITRDRQAVLAQIDDTLWRLGRFLKERIETEREENISKIRQISNGLLHKYIEPMRVSNESKMQEVRERIFQEWKELESRLQQKQQILEALNPERVLAQGYAIIDGKIAVGNVVKITTSKQLINAQVKEVYERKTNA